MLDILNTDSGSATLRSDGLPVAGHPETVGAKGVATCGTSIFLERSNGDICVGSTDDLRRHLRLINKGASFDERRARS